MARRRRCGTKNAPIVISDSDDETSFSDSTTPVIDLTGDDKSISNARQRIRLQFSTQKTSPTRTKSTTIKLSNRNTSTGSARPSNPLQQESSNKNSSEFFRLGRKVESLQGTSYASHTSTGWSSSLRVGNPLIQRKPFVLLERPTGCAHNFSTSVEERHCSKKLPAQRAHEVQPLRKDYRLPTYDSPPQHKYSRTEDESLRKLRDESSVGVNKRKLLFCKFPQLPVGIGTAQATKSNPWDRSLVNIRDHLATSKHKGKSTRETSPRVALAKAQSITSDRGEVLETSTSISVRETEWILREERDVMQNEHSKSVRNYLCDALILRNKCRQKLPNFCDDNDLFTDMESIPVDNDSANKTKRKWQASGRIKKTAIVVLPHETSNRRVPAYKHYIPIKQNILVPDTRYLAFDPYLGDVEGDKAIKARNKWLVDYRNEFEINNDDEGEKTIWLNEYLLRILERLGLHLDDVKTFGVPKDIDSLKCATVFKKVKSIEVFINAFRNVFEKEVQDIIPGTVEQIQKSKLPQNLQASPNKIRHAEQLLEVYLTECPSCHMFACGIHGDYESDEDCDGESESSTSEKQDESFSDGTEESSDEFSSIRDIDGFDSAIKDCFRPVEKWESKKIRSPQPLFVDLNTTLEGTLARWDRRVAEPAAHRAKKKQDETNPCSAYCFLKVECSHVGFLDWKEEDLQLLQTLLRGVEHDRRAACVLAPIFRKHCYNVQNFISLVIAQQKDSQKNIQSEPRVHSGRPKQKYWYDNIRKTIRKNVVLDKVTRAHYAMKCHQPMGCEHIGLLCAEAGDRCGCLMDKIPCDKFCACNDDCFMKFKGCDCSRIGRPCSTNKSKCACQMLNRECDPDLCHSCGAAEMANPFTRNGEPPANSCFNTEIQRGVGKRLLVGESSHPDDIGFGAFLAERVNEDEFIAEYVGEVISANEADLRWRLYEQLGLSYLFDLNKEMRVDSYRYGNKTRFINHGRKRANCYPRIKLVNGEHRIAFYAKKNLAAGVELFFNYGKQFVENHGLKEESGDEADEEDEVRPLPPDVLPAVPEDDTDEYEEERPAKRAKISGEKRPKKLPF